MKDLYTPTHNWVQFGPLPWLYQYHTKCCIYILYTVYNMYIYYIMYIYNIISFILMHSFWIILYRKVPTTNHTTQTLHKVHQLLDQRQSRGLGSPVHVSAMLCGCGFPGSLRPAPNHRHGQLLWNFSPGKKEGDFLILSQKPTGWGWGWGNMSMVQCYNNNPLDVCPV